MLFTYRVFILFIFGSIGASSCNISIRKTSLHLIQGWTYFNFELIPPSLNRHHQLFVSGKIVSHKPLLLNPATILLLFVKITYSRDSGVIANVSLFRNAVRALSIMKLSIVCLIIVLNGLNNVMSKGWTKWVALAGSNTKVI